MPLVTSHTDMTLLETPAASVAFLMAIDGPEPRGMVRVVATSASIDMLDPQGGRKGGDPLSIAKGERMRIESAASAKFDKYGADSHGEIVLDARDLP